MLLLNIATEFVNGPPKCKRYCSSRLSPFPNKFVSLYNLFKHLCFFSVRSTVTQWLANLTSDHRLSSMFGFDSHN